MAKKDIRIITASTSLASLIDRGAAVDVELKNLGFEDKGIKSKLGEQVCFIKTGGHDDRHA